MSSPRGRKRIGIVLVAGLALTVPALASNPAPVGSVSQVTGKAGCYTTDGSSDEGPNTCKGVRGSVGETTIALSPDDRFAYSVGYGTSDEVSAIQVYKRSPKSGALHQLKGKKGCVSGDGSSEEGPHTCANGRQIDTGDGHSIVISSDGRFLYSASQLLINNSYSGGVAIFRRDRKTGAITQLHGKAGCVSDKGLSEDGSHTCTAAREVALTAGVQLSPDQQFLYATDYVGDPSGGIAIFKRSTKTGKLKQLDGKDGCITSDGTAFQMSGTPCRAGVKLDNTWELALPDNKYVYAPASQENLVAGFKRNKAGGLVPLQGKSSCVSDDGSSLAGPDTCIDGRGLKNVERVLLSKNERFIYTAGYDPTQAAVLNRNPKTGALSQRSGKASCITEDGTSDDGADTCRLGRGFNGGYAGDVSRDGKTLYFANYNAGGFAILRLNPDSGAFKQLPGKKGCVTLEGASSAGPDTCIDGRATQGAYETTLSHEGRDLYVPSNSDNGIAHFRVKR